MEAYNSVTVKIKQLLIALIQTLCKQRNKMPKKKNHVQSSIKMKTEAFVWLTGGGQCEEASQG